MSEAIIQVQDLVRKYGSLTAVNRINFAVNRGEIFGFLGPNGAGKTTTINMLCTLLLPTEGRAVVAGHDVARDPGKVRHSIGLVFQDPSLDERLTAMENLRFHALLYSVPREVFHERAERLLQMVDLADKKKHKVRTFSGGMKRRLEIARGLLHHPDILFLDEPTIGLDPQTRKHIWDYLRRLRDDEGITMFMTTHYMDEAENCDRIAIIDHGEIVALDSPDGLRARVGGDVVTVRTSNDEAVRTHLAERYGLEARGAPGGGLIVETEQGDQFIPELIRSYANGEDGVQVRGVNLRRPTIDDVFIKLTGHDIREEEVDPGREDMRQHQRMTRRG